MAEEKQQYRADNYHESFDPSKLKNADLNISQYGDDSSMKNYNDPNRWGGENAKYEGEATKNSQVAYNPNATIEGLDPNYKYGHEAQMANSDEANYIARRNDEIASALYNAGKTSQLDVADFLNSQQGFYNSNSDERHNTVQSIWKRLGQMAEQNNQGDTKSVEPTNTPQDTDNEAVSNMESELNQSTAGELYGKVTAEEGNPQNGINTLEDANSIYRQIDAKRIETFKDLQAMDSQSIAAAIVSGAMASDTQAMRDLMQYNSAKYQEVKQAEKRLIGQMNINSIASGSGEWTSSMTNGQSGINNEIVDFAISNSNGVKNSADILKDVSQSLSSNINAATAQEQMAALEGDMATLQNRLKNLKNEAKSVFKGDVPAYIVGAYISNRTMEIQDQLSILENRYNAAYSRYQDQVKQTQRQMEFGLKQQELDMKRQSFALDKWTAEQGMNLKREQFYAENGMSAGVNGNSVPTTTLTRDEISQSVDDLVKACQNGELGKNQCAAGVQKYYLPILGVDFGSLSAYSAKQGICNEFAGEYTPQKGDIVVMSSKTQPQYGHMGMVVGIDGDTMTYLDWNGTVKDGVGTEEPEIRTIKLNDGKLYGYYNPTKQGGQVDGVVGGMWTRKDGEQFDTGNSALFNSLSAEDKKTVLGLLNLAIDPSTLQTRYGYDKGQAQKLLNAAMDINPLWTDGDKKAAQTSYQNWNKDVQQQGKSKNGTAISTAFEVMDLADKIGNRKRKDWNSMINEFKNRLSNEEFIELNSNIYLLVSEYAGALKGTASPTNQDIEEAKQIVATNFSKGGIKTATESIIRALYNKNANEASNYLQVTLTKPNMLVTPKIADRMAEMGLDMTIYGDYNQKGNGKTAGGYAPKFGSEVYNSSSIGDLLK